MNTDGLNLDETLALTEKLQKAEARALEAESFITQIQEIANSSDGIVGYHLNGEILRWNEFDWPNEDSINAAREVMRKAEEWDRAEGKQDALYARWKCDYANLSAERDVLWKSKERWKSSAEELAVERDTLRTERDELAALVEQWREVLVLCTQNEQLQNGSTWLLAEIHKNLANIPATALADLKAQWGREVLEEAGLLEWACTVGANGIMPLDDIYRIWDRRRETPLIDEIRAAKQADHG